jgi:hypothetical protein
MTAGSTSTPTARALRGLAHHGKVVLVRAAIAGGRGLAMLARLAWTKRSLLVALAVRVAFWGALALWLSTALTVVGGAPLEVDRAVHGFATGAVICGFAVVLAVARHVRWASWALGSLHGASATVLWLLVAT